MCEGRKFRVNAGKSKFMMCDRGMEMGVERM